MSCDIYSRGQWASSLKYNDGTFYLHFNVLGEGSYLLTTSDPEGTWTKTKLSSSFYDAGLFFDDDDKIYIVSGINNLHIAELDTNFNVVQDKAITLGNTDSIDNSATEGSHLYKINGYYYIYATTGGYYATQVIYRSENIFGPYDEKEVYNKDRIHQGALVETQTGEWWTVLFADKGAYGRLPYLLPVEWVDNWPVIGNNDLGNSTFYKPNVGREFQQTSLPTNDNFRNYKLGMQWGWNHNPDNSKWSLFERPDYLRLRTVNVTDSFHLAKNTLTQRILGYPDNLNHSYGTVKIEIDSMLEGDITGLAVFQDPYAYIGVKMAGGQKELVMYNDGVVTSGPAVPDSVIYLRAVANYNTSKAGFYYSFDNETYTKLGTDLNMKFELTIFTGNKFCLFNFATQQTGGFVDFDWFTTEENFSEDNFYDNSFTGYSEDAITLVDLEIDTEKLYLLTGSTAGINVRAIYADEHSEDVSIGATYTNHNSDIIQISNGQIIAKADGEASFSISYKGLLGNTISKEIQVISSTFPLVDGLFDPSIYATGTFDEETHTLHTGQYGFGGWSYSNGVDLSEYKYLVARLGSDNTSSVSFRIFDENNYWSGAAEYNFGGTREVVVPIADMVKAGATTKLDPSHIYIVGFWSSGGNPFVVDTVFLSNSGEYDPPVIYAKALNGTEIEEMTEFSYQKGFGPSATQSFTVSGDSLDNDIVVRTTNGFELAMDSTQIFVSNLTLQQTKGRVTETTVYVRLKTGLPARPWAGEITITSTGATAKKIVLSGMVEEVTGIETPASGASVIATDYYTLTGQRIRNIENMRGIYIEKKTYSDGSAVTKKIFNEKNNK